MEEPRRPRILLCLSGSVATVKCPEIATRFAEFADVRIVTTKSARHFFNLSKNYNREKFAAWLNVKQYQLLYSDVDEWNAYQTIGLDPVVHIELRKWADLMIVAPASANTIAKLNSGLCDNLLTSIARAWDFRKPFIVAPAMNTHMWDHPHTAKHLNNLRNDLGMKIILPISKTLACGDIGTGALATVDTIVDVVAGELKRYLAESDIRLVNGFPLCLCCAIEPATTKDKNRLNQLCQGHYEEMETPNNCFVARDVATGVVHGFVQYNENGNEVFVTRLLVDSNHRGHGIGAQLLEHLHAYCVQSGNHGEISGQMLDNTGFFMSSKMANWDVDMVRHIFHRKF